ncbi:MAG: sigma-70 family RNA polymerase sigma factor [Pseudomonadota bacterium]
MAERGERYDLTVAHPVSNPARQSDRLSEADKTVSHLYAEQLRPLAAYLRKVYGSGPPDPEDIAQEAFQRLIEHHDLSSIRNLRAFLWRTARNLVISNKRSVARRTKYDYEIEQLYFAIESPGSDPESVLATKEQLLIIDQVLQSMPARRRKAFLWHRVDQMSFTAIGKKLGITRRAVARHVVKAACEIQTAMHEVAEKKA